MTGYYSEIFFQTKGVRYIAIADEFDSEKGGNEIAPFKNILNDMISTVNIKTYFIKMSELRDKFTAARRAGKEAAILNGLVRPSCLIIDEVGHCEFDKENTRLFFDLIDRRYNKEGSCNIIFTSNKHPSKWKANFNEDDALLCTLDRIFDDAIVFNIKGEGYRGKRLETLALQTSRVKAPEPEQTPAT